MDASAWTPNGPPVWGDVAIIANGSPVASNLALSDTTFILGSSANPTLTFSNASIGSDTLIESPQTPASSGTSAATIVTQGDVTFAGTIGLAVNGSGQPSILNFLIEAPLDYGTTVNQGTINIAPGQTTNLNGYTYGGHEGEALFNNGVINVYGTIVDETVGIFGTGTINLDAVSNGLGLPATPSFLELAGNYSPGLLGIAQGAIEPQQNVVFNGGHLAIDGGDWEPAGELWNFAANPSNMIQLKDFTLNTDTQQGGTVVLTGTSGKPISLLFADLPETTGELYYVRNGSETDVVWHSYPVDPSPIHLPPSGPPGHKLI